MAMTPVPEEPHKRSKVLIWFTILLFIIALLWLAYWFFYLQYYQSTDDAYANGNLVNVNSAVSGSVVAFFADDTELVLEGQLLVMLDRTPYQISYEKELNGFSETFLQVKQLFDQVNVSRSKLDKLKTVLADAQYNYDNRLKLVDTQAISNQDFIHAKNSLSVAELDFQEAKYQLEAAQDAVGNYKLENHPLLEKQKSNVYQAYYSLKHCSIYAPYTGFVAKRTVNVGDWVSPNIPLMAVIPSDYMWVDANYKETQLTYMRIGQPAIVWFDIYGSKVIYKGKVLGIASGSGSVFSLIPPQNATGNWIKIVQRLPVRISLDPEVMEKYPLRLGISANVEVDITDQNLPIMGVPSEKPVAITKVFDLDFKEVDKILAEIMGTQ